MPQSHRSELIRALPYARRYARALTGSQPRGDLLVAESLRELVTQQGGRSSARHDLYRVISIKAAALEKNAPQNHTLPLSQRELLLLTALEGLPSNQAAEILGIDPKAAVQQIDDAYKTIRSVSQTAILIIEDEPIIAMDIEDLVIRCGHTVAGIAHTQADAIALAKETKPGLILADINLGNGGNGMDAVAEIMRTMSVPVIFVTAYPECLLTGNTIEPAFVITKPFDPLMLAVATYQAITGGVPVP